MQVVEYEHWQLGGQDTRVIRVVTLLREHIVFAVHMVQMVLNTTAMEVRHDNMIYVVHVGYGISHHSYYISIFTVTPIQSALAMKEYMPHADTMTIDDVAHFCWSDVFGGDIVAPGE